MRALVVGDVHLADRPPSIRRETYLEEVLEKLSFCVSSANREGVDFVVQLGDLFHVKAPSRTSHELVQRTADVLTEASMPVLIVPGNHDMQNDRIASLPKQPLGTLCKVEGIDMLMGPHPTLPVFGIPYLYDWATLLPRFMKAFRAWADRRKGEDFGFWPLVATHAPIFPDRQEPIYDFIAASDWAALQEVGDCAYGHIHDPHGRYGSAPSNVRFCNMGAISRGSLHEATLKREPTVSIWDPDGPEPHFTPVPVPHLPADRVFRLAEREDVDARQERVGEFLSGIRSTELRFLTVEEVVAHAERSGLRPRALEQLRDCVEEATTRGG